MSRRFGGIRKLPSGRYQATIATPQGSRIAAPITFEKESQAETWLAAQRTDMARETWRAPTAGARPLKNYADDWLTTRTDLRPRTAELYERLLRLHIEPELGRMPIKGITPAMVRAWHAGLGAATGPTARAQSYRLLRAIFNQAVRDGEITSNPCQLRGAATPATSERPPPTLTQIHRLAELVPARYRAMVLLAAYSGLRFGELTALTRADLQLDGKHMPSVGVRRSMSRVHGTWVVGEPKTAAGVRVVTLPRFLRPVLVDHLEEFVGPRPSSLLFATASGRPLARSNWSATFGRAKTKIGRDDIHFHDLRHAAATAAVQSGATLKDTMARLGHASPRAALIYQHTARDRDEAIAAALDRAAAKARKPSGKRKHTKSS
jgi:integrase